MKSRGSLLRCLAFVSISVVSLLYVCKLGRAHRRTPSVSSACLPHTTLALEAGQTILAVADTLPSLRFYIGNDAVDEREDERQDE